MGSEYLSQALSCSPSSLPTQLQSWCLGTSELEEKPFLSWAETVCELQLRKLTPQGQPASLAHLPCRMEGRSRNQQHYTLESISLPLLTLDLAPPGDRHLVNQRPSF